MPESAKYSKLQDSKTKAKQKIKPPKDRLQQTVRLIVQFQPPAILLEPVHEELSETTPIRPDRISQEYLRASKILRMAPDIAGIFCNNV